MKLFLLNFIAHPHATSCVKNSFIENMDFIEARDRNTKYNKQHYIIEQI